MPQENYPWYTVVTGAELHQGDLLNNCPVLVPISAVPANTPDNQYVLDGAISRYNLIVMSQSCDLEHDKLNFVLICAVWPLEQLAAKDNFLKSANGRKALLQGGLPGYHLLNKCDLTGWEQGARVVDFRSVYSLPLEFIKQLADQRGPRLRLLPPYREHLSQAFARFFMRVGLPVPVELN